MRQGKKAGAVFVSRPNERAGEWRTMSVHDLNVDCALALAVTAVSRETAARRDRFAALL
jgi:hypothetical protein